MNSTTHQEQWLRAVYGKGFDAPDPEAARELQQQNPELPGDDPWLACGAGDLARVRAAVASDPEWVNRAGGPLNMPPLVAVTFSGFTRVPEDAPRMLSCARALLDAGADVDSGWNSPDWPANPFSALYGAAGYNHNAAMTRLLLDRGANPNDGESLYHSLETSDLEITRMLLEAGARVPQSNALFHVLDGDRLEALQLLLAHGADPNEVGPQGHVPLQWAIRRRRSAAHIQALLDAGADPMNSGTYGVSPYRMAMRYGLPDLAALFPAESLPLTDRFVAACARADRETATALRGQDPELISKLSPDQLRKLPELAATGQDEAVRIMVELGWPVDVVGGDWSASALNHAVFRGSPRLAAFLLEHGADWTVLHGYDDTVVGTLSWASLHQPVPFADWLGCARVLMDHGVPKPGSEYRFSHEIEQFFARFG